MRVLVRSAVLLLVLGLATTAGTGSASAAVATEVPRPADGLYTCPGVGHVTLPTDKGTYSPGRVVATGELFRPYAFTFTVAIGGEDPPSTVLSVVKRNAPSDGITCETTTQQVDELGNVIALLTYTVSGTLNR